MSLVDVKFRPLGAREHELVAVISRGDPTPQRLSRGVYLARHWNFGDLLMPELDYEAQYREVKTTPPHYQFFAFGVCDSPEQFKRTVGKALEADKRLFVVSLVHIQADGQAGDGGWRWRKWGAYVGEGKPTTEYIHDEPVLREVYTYHFYEVTQAHVLPQSTVEFVGVYPELPKGKP